MKEMVSLCWDIGRADDAADYLRKIAKAYANTELGMTAMELEVSNDVRRGKPEEALAKAKALIEKYPDADMSRRLLFQMALIYWYDLEDHAKSREVLKGFIAKYPSGMLSELARARLGLEPRARRKVQEVKDIYLSSAPNPFNSRTVVKFALPEDSSVRLEIYDVLGRKVRKLFEGRKEAGRYSMIWDGKDERGRDVSSGVYVIRLEVGKENLSRKLILLR